MNATVEQGTATQNLTFKIGEELFAVDVIKVREVLELLYITKIPRTPDFMKGVINLRGSVVPVVDMRQKFGMSAKEATVDTCIVVLEIEQDRETVVLGALVDAVEEVVELEPEHIEPPPRIGTGLNVDFIHGMGKREEQFIIILNTDRMFNAEELAIVKEPEKSSLRDQETEDDQ